MFCSNCGSQVGDNSLFCPGCGNKLMRPASQAQTPQQGQPQSYRQEPYQTQPQGYQQEPYQTQPQGYQQEPYQTQPQGYNGPEPKKPSSKKPIIIGVAAAAAVVVILLIVFVIKPGGGNMSTPEGTVQKMEAALNELDFKKLIECCDSSTRALVSASGSELDELNSMIETVKLFGAKMEFKLALDPGTLNYYEKNGSEFCDGSLNMSYTVSALGQTQSDSATQTVTFIKENGKWYIYGGESIEDFGSFLF